MRRPRTVREVAERLGVELRPCLGPFAEVPDPYRIVGMPPVGNVHLCAIPGQENFIVSYATDVPWASVVEPVLHELAHLACGPLSLWEEAPVMALQGQLTLALQGEDYGPCRKGIEDFGAPWEAKDGTLHTLVGHLDNWMKSEHHRLCVSTAVQFGVMNHRRTLNWDRMRDFTRWEPWNAAK